MKEYVTTQPVELHAGRIGLNKTQAAIRAPYLTQKSPGVYTITGPVQFKAGEVICLDPDKATLAKLKLTETGRAELEKEKTGKSGKGKAE